MLDGEMPCKCAKAGVFVEDFPSKIIDTHVRCAKLDLHGCIYGHSSVW